MTTIIGRPALLGHLGEFVASSIFGIALENSATARRIDGRFTGGPLAGRSVNVKWYDKQERLLDLHADEAPDFYLVLAGPPGRAVSSRGDCRPWAIDMHLFESSPLLGSLASRAVKIGVATSVARHLWDAAEVFPRQKASIRITSEQCALLQLFSSKVIGVSAPMDQAIL